MNEPDTKKPKMSSSLVQLKKLTTVVADTGDFEGTFMQLTSGFYPPSYQVSQLLFANINMKFIYNF